MKPFKIVIVDDHLLIRKGLQLMLEEQGNTFEVVGHAADGRAAIEVVNQMQPDVVLMDIRMPLLDGIGALEYIRSHWPYIAVLLLTTYEEDELMIRGLQAGARGYLLKQASAETLITAITTVT